MADSGSNGKGGFLSTLKEVTFFVAIYLYFTGFVYIYYFYDHFGISLRVIETPFYYFFVYSYNVVRNLAEIKWAAFLSRHSVWALLITAFILSLIFMTIRRKKHLLLFIVLVSLFPLLYSLAFETANIEANNIRRGITAKEITLVFKSDAKISAPQKILKDTDTSGSQAGANKQTKDAKGQVPSEPEETAETESLNLLLEANKRIELQVLDAGNELPRLYLLTETSDSFYVLYQPRFKGAVYTGYVYEIPKSEVILINIQIPAPLK